MGADHAATDYQHLGRRNTGHTAQQNAAPAIGFLQRPGANLRGQTARHFGHRRQQRQAATVVGHGFIGDRGDARGQQISGLFRIGRKVQIGEQKLARTQALAFDRPAVP